MLFKAFTALAVATAAFAQNAFRVETPAALIQCQPVQISWVGGTAPYILATIPAGQTSAPAISTLSTSLSSSPYTWIVNLAAGTSINLRLTDATGVVVYSSDRTIQPGASDACLNASASTSGLATTGAITTTGTGSQTLTATSATGASSAVSVSSASRASSASAAASSAAASSAPASSAAASSAPAGSSRPATSSTPVSATSAAASVTPSSGAVAGAFAGVPAIAAGILGGLAVLL